MSKTSQDLWVWVTVTAIALYATRGLVFGKRKGKGGKGSGGSRRYKFPAAFPDEWDGRTVELKSGRRYIFPLPQPDEGTYWTLEFTTEEGTQAHRQAIDDEDGAVGWYTTDGEIFTWITPTDGLLETKITIALWTDDGYVQEVHELTVRKR